MDKYIHLVAKIKHLRASLSLFTEEDCTVANELLAAADKHLIPRYPVLVSEEYDKYYCSECGRSVYCMQPFCDQCGVKIGWYEDDN